jgi:hypothetical protein
VVGEKYLQLDPDNPVVLVLTASALLDGLNDADKDREVKIEKIGTLRNPVVGAD